MNRSVLDFPRGLYGMVDLPVKPGTGGVPSTSHLAQALLDGGTRVLQVRMKGGTAAAVLAVLDELNGLIRRYPGTRIIVNDRLDVALAGGAGGVHLGQSDLPLHRARRICPPGFVVGISTHDERQVEEAVAGGADYIAFGPIYQTQSKPDPDPVVGVKRLQAVCRSSPVPVVAIGGITLLRVPEVVAAGALAVAIISAVNQAQDVREAAAQVGRMFFGGIGAGTKK